jgi:tape measure domain-containing protein
VGTLNALAVSAKKGGSVIQSLGKGLEFVRKTWGAIQNVMNGSDELNAMNARLALVNDGLRSQAAFQKQVLDVANRTGDSYTATADFIARIGAETNGVFKNNDQMLAFAENFNKSLAISGASPAQAQDAMQQMAQSLGDGVLQGDELRSLAGPDPALLRILSDGLGVSVKKLQQMGDEGQLTADKIVQAFAHQSEQVDQMFQRTPMSFGRAMTAAKNTFQSWFATLGQANGPLQKITEKVRQFTAYMQSDAGQRLFAGLTSAVSVAVDRLVQLADWAGRVFVFFSDNWSTIGPIVTGVAVAFGGLVLAINGAAIVTKGFEIATKAASIAQQLLNAAARANPYVLIAALIAGLIAYLIRLWQTNDQFAAGLIGIWNTILNFFDQVPIFFLQVGNGIVNGFLWAKVEALKLIENLVNGVIDQVNWLTGKLNKIFGTSFEPIPHVSFAAQAAAEAQAVKQAGEDLINRMRADAAAKAAQREQDRQNFINSRAAKHAAGPAAANSRVANPPAAEAAGKPNGNPYSVPLQSSPVKADIDSVNRVNEVGKINDTVDVSSEDLQTMRELAEMKNIQNFVTLQPQLTFGDTHVRQDGRSVDEIIANIRDRLNEEIVSSARGVYGG